MTHTEPPQQAARRIDLEVTHRPRVMPALPWFYAWENWDCDWWPGDPAPPFPAWGRRATWREAYDAATEIARFTGQRVSVSRSTMDPAR